MKTIILDCDPGYDDIVALMMAYYDPNINIAGITVVAGNQPIENSVKTTFDICSYLGIDIPIYKGSKKPLVREQIIAKGKFSQQPLNNITFDSKDNYQCEDAINFIIKTLRQSSSPIVINATGPLTNIAKAIKQDPSIIENIDSIILMGGALECGNITPYAEFNFFADPEAAEIVLNSKCKIFMITLDTTSKAICSSSMIESINCKTSKPFLLLKEILELYQGDTNHIMPLHDPLTIGYLIDNSIFDFEENSISINTDFSSKEYGRVFKNSNSKSIVKIATEYNNEKFYNLLFSLLNKHQ